jgi:hypothetical protein
MFTRRTFLAQSAIAGGLAAVATSAAWGRDDLTVLTSSPRRTKAPFIKGVIRRDETSKILGRGVGDSFPICWGNDNRQYVSICDGNGYFEGQKDFNTRVFAISGDAENAVLDNLPGYPSILHEERLADAYGFGMAAVNGRIYQFLTSENLPLTPENIKLGERHVGVTAIYSPDSGRTWCNAHGSTPVARQTWESRSRSNMLFFEETQDAFAFLCPLQMGRNYEANRDGYVYIYSPNGSADGTMNQLVMLRVLKTRILDRSAYEFFGGFGTAGRAVWVKAIDERATVHSFPGGWVNKTEVPFAWFPSVTYNIPLGLYMMASFGNSAAADGRWFAKPSYLGIWVAQHPWGPWTQIHEDLAWMPNGDHAARCYCPQIAPKWISRDGKSFWMIWSDYQGEYEFETSPEAQNTPPAQLGAVFRKYMKGYVLNMQQVDLII